MLIDAGLGDKESDKFHQLYGVDRARTLDHALADARIAPDDIDLVIASHLHFDHAGGFTTRDAAGRVRPHFPRARYVVRRGEWDDATHPHDRNRASYLADNFIPLAEAGLLDLVDEDQAIVPGIRVQRTGGHTMHHQIVWIESGGGSRRVSRRPHADERAPRRPVDHGLRPLPDGYAFCQAGVWP